MITLRKTGSVLRFTVLGMLLACALSAAPARADVTVTVDPGTIANGYMNVSELPSNGGGFVFGSGWGIGDLVATYAGSDLTLSPNVIGDPNVFWYQCVGASTPPNCGGPGSPGNKIMEANIYGEQNGGGPLTGTTVVFIGNVTSNTLAASHSVIAFIKDFAPDFSSSASSTVVLPASGQFKLALPTINDPGRHVQYGFQMTGPDVWNTDVAPYGSVTIAPLDFAVPAHRKSWGTLKMMYR